jgi:peroxiredoxin
MSDRTKRLERGAEAPDFRAETFDGKALSLRELTERGPVVLVLLRGFS